MNSIDIFTKMGYDRTYLIFVIEKLLAPYASISLNVILYPFGPVVRPNDNESILNGSIFGKPMSGMPEMKTRTL